MEFTVTQPYIKTLRLSDPHRVGKKAAMQGSADRSACPMDAQVDTDAMPEVGTGELSKKHSV